MNNDFWYLPQCCAGCGHAGNESKDEPVSLLDVETKLCEYCYEDLKCEALELTEK